MNPSTRPLLTIIGGIAGIPVGAAIGFYVVRFGGPLVYGPDFYQIGWLLLMFTVPVGAVVGATLGALTFPNRPRLFLCTFLPLAILIVGQQLTLRVLRAKDMPRTYVLRIGGNAGAEFVGGVRADGELRKLRGNLPAEFEYSAQQVELAFALVDPNVGDKISVEVLVDGTPPQRVSESEWGIHELFDSFGYAEWAGGTSYCGGGDMSPEEVADLVEHHTMPPKGIGMQFMLDRSPRTRR